MKQTVLFMLEDGNAQTVEAQAFSKETANIIITAATMQEAQELLTQGEEMARQAMRNWKPEEQPEEPAQEEEQKEHYRTAPFTIEEANRQMDEYEQTTNGKRFCRGLELAHDFTARKDHTGFYTCTQAHYLALLGYAQDIFEAILLSYCYGFKKGYKNAKKGGK